MIGAWHLVNSRPTLNLDKGLLYQHVIENLGSRREVPIRRRSAIKRVVRFPTNYQLAVTSRPPVALRGTKL